MKKNYYPIAILIALLFYIPMGAQSDQKNFINYQGVARDSDNAIMKEATLEVGIALKFGSATSSAEYEESHTVNTDANGMFSLQIGNGNSINGNYENLPWGQATFMAVSLNGSEVGTTEMMAVPYAITSGDADDQSASEVPYDNSVSGLTANTTQGAIDELVTGGVIDADADPTNEFQTLSFEPGTNELSLSNGNTITIPSGGTDADADPTNEIDVTTKNGLLFGDGTTVNGLMGTAEGQVPKWDNASSSWVVGIDATGGGGGSSLWKNAGADLFYDEGKVGIGITPTSLHHIHGLATGATQYTTSSSGTTISDGVHVGVTNDLDGSPIGFLQNKGDGPLQFGTNNITRMQIDKSGNVGIGVFEPQAKLHVDGNLLSEALAGVGQRNVVADANGKLVIGAGGGGSGASGLEVIEEGGRQGWRLIGRDAAQYGDIGNDATDLSESDEIYNDKGATGANSFAAGFATKASGNFSTAMGDLTAATGSMSTALGESTVASETASTALGQFTIASGQAATSMGFNTEASGYNAVAMGEGVKAESSSSLAIGRFNIGGGTASSWVDTDPLFEIGNGSGIATRNNAFTVLKNGYVGIGLEAPLAVLHVDGDIRSSDLAGVGQRNVMADAEGNLVIGAGGGVDADADPENELQDLSLSGTTLQITDGASVDLSTILPPGGTDDQIAAEVPFDNTISGLTATDTQAAIDELATSGLVDTDDQALILTGDILTIEDGVGSIDLSVYGDDGDADPTNEIDVTAETGILLGDGTNVTGLIGTADGQVAKWNAGTNSWEAGTDAIGGGGGDAPTGLETLDEGNGIGWRLIGRDPSRYGNIGEDATDLSSGDSGSNTHGATGEVSTAMGEGTTASGQYATAMGYYNIASGQASTAMGTETNASGYSSATLGDGASASGSVATAMGASTGASGDYSTAMGQGTRADAYNSTAIGRFNVGGGDENAWQPNDPLFEIGNGTFASRSNALTLLKNGNMGLGTEAPTAHLEISSTQERPFILRSTSANNYMQYITPSGFIGYSGVWSGDNDVDFGTTSINAIGKVHLTTQATPKLTVTSNGNIGIGGTTPTAKLHIFQGGQGLNTGLRFTDGTANEDWSVRHGFGLSFFYGSDLRATISANNGAYIQGSDASLKTKVTKLSSVLDRVGKLRATTYRYKSDKNQNRTMGFIAQEVQPIFPELVETMGPEEILGINYAGFSVVAIRAIQEQQQIIDSQSTKIADLEERLNRLEAKFGN